MSCFTAFIVEFDFISGIINYREYVVWRCKMRKYFFGIFLIFLLYGGVLYGAEYYSVNNFYASENILAFENFTPAQYEEEMTSRSLFKKSWAHCFAMSYMTKVFFYNADFTSSSRKLSEEELLTKIENVLSGKHETFPEDNLFSLSQRYKIIFMKALLPLQKKLFFSFSNLPFLLNKDPKKEFAKVKSSIMKNELALVGMKFSLMYQHVVLAYAYYEDEKSITLQLYDSNYPALSADGDMNCTLKYNKHSGEVYNPLYGKISNVFFIDK